jgi:uncharacterized SAM-binding protein YcdF (DUF218 family)
MTARSDPAVSPRAPWPLRAALWLVLLAALLLSGTFAILAGVTAGHRSLAEPPATAPLVVVLGGGIRYDGVLHPRSTNHMREAIRFFDEGRVDAIHFSGGALGPIPEAHAMRRLAIEAGVPGSAITIEDRSTSTLQNALYTREAIGPLPPGTVIVTDRTHMARAWLSFWWAGERGHVMHSAPIWPREGRWRRLQFVARESLAVWYNLARMGEATVLLRLGVEPAVVAERLARSPLAWGPPS